MKKHAKPVLGLLLTIALGLSTGCGKTAEYKEETTLNTKMEEQPFYADRTAPEYLSQVRGIEKLEEKIDYSNPKHWMVMPEKNEKNVDAIYIYPTVYGTLSEAEDDIADIDDTSMRVMALYSAANQASVFDENCNVYAPYYRQFTVESLLDIMDNSPESLSYIASRDLYPMLDYYFENLNEGRPFILAGHSQGSVWLTVILEDYMKAHPEYLEKMIAAYAIGYSVTKDYLEKNPHLKFAQGADDTGVIISYNTEGAGNKEAYNCVVKEGAIAINPINWRLDDTYATKEENLGTLEESGELIKNYADARLDVERGVVVCSSVKNSTEIQNALRKYFGPESFHLQDYNLYYGNLQQNVADRIDAFMKK